MQINKIKTLKRNFQVFLMLIFLMSSFLMINHVSANPKTGIEAATNGLNTAANKGFDNDSDTEAPSSIMTDIPEAIGKIIGAGLAFIGVLFFILMIYGGLIWMLARGNEADVTRAKELIQAAVIGLVIVLAAYAITNFISSRLVK